jgi:hypothetical protein
MKIKYTTNHAICRKFKKYLNMTAQYIYITSMQCLMHTSCTFYVTILIVHLLFYLLYIPEGSNLQITSVWEMEPTL